MATLTCLAPMEPAISVPETILRRLRPIRHWAGIAHGLPSHRRPARDHVKYGDQDNRSPCSSSAGPAIPPESPYHWHAERKTRPTYGARLSVRRDNWSPWIGVMSLIYVADPDWTEADEQYWWAITDPSYPESAASRVPGAKSHGQVGYLFRSEQAPSVILKAPVVVRVGDIWGQCPAIISIA